jgi:hypothetical protein
MRAGGHCHKHFKPVIYGPSKISSAIHCYALSDAGFFKNELAYSVTPVSYDRKTFMKSTPEFSRLVLRLSKVS